MLAVNPHMAEQALQADLQYKHIAILKCQSNVDAYIEARVAESMFGDILPDHEWHEWFHSLNT